MRDHMVKYEVKEVAIPQIGCGIDGLKWDEVSKRLHKVFDGTDVVITVYIYVP